MKTTTQIAPVGLIRQAINRNCGGMSNATEPELLLYWNSLSEKVREMYLDSVTETPEEGTENNAGQ